MSVNASHSDIVLLGVITATNIDSSFMRQLKIIVFCRSVFYKGTRQLPCIRIS